MKREPHWVKLFLRELSLTGNVRLAAERAGVDFSTAYQRRKRHAAFAQAWEGALGAFAVRHARSEREREVAPPPSTKGSMVPLPTTSAQGGAELVTRPGGKVIKGSGARWGKRAEEAFLLELTVSANVRIAARAAGFSTAAVYKRRMKDRHFSAACEAALETGKARIQAYLVEAATRTFDPDELPIADDRELPKVSIGEAIHIARLPARDAGAAAGFARGGKGFEGRTFDETGFDTTPISRDEWEQAKQNIVDRLGRLRQQMEEKERETGLCHSCGQPLPADG